jgi:hypothetical protein
MHINLVPDSSVAAAPTGFTAAVEAAANVFEQDFPGDYTVNITYGWGTFDNTAYEALTNTGSGVFSLGGGPATAVSYAQLKSWLKARAGSSAQMTAVASLPASSASLPGGAASFSISSAELKALGVFSGNPSAVDGSIGFNVGDTNHPEDWEAAAITEIVHALGWSSIAQDGGIPSVADLFRYSAPGAYGWTSGQPAYFSIDGGETNLGDFSTSFDQTLFSNLPGDDSLRLPLISGAATLTSFDIEALSVIGFGVATPAPPRPFIAGGSSPEVLWQNVTGQVSVWRMNGNAQAVGGPVAVNPGPSWTDVAVGDFNGDGLSDILWRNADGRVAVWEMSGSTKIGGGPVALNPGPGWNAVGAGDFDGDGFSDILWQNTSTAQVAIWDMDGATRIGGGPVSFEPGPDWTAVGTGDFNRDGFFDILWQNTSTGQISVWEMDGTAKIGGGKVVTGLGPEWHALGAGDFNHDGFSDILLRDVATGQIAIAEMHGSTEIGGGLVSVSPGLSWNVVGTGDFNSDGFSDVLFQNANTGQIAVWEMNGNTRIGGGTVGVNPGTAWRAA